MLKVSMLKYLSLIIILFGCSGYRFNRNNNPLAPYGIESLSVPMFYNYSSISEIAPLCAQQTYQLLTTFSGLKIYPGYESSADAVLIGIIKSPENQREALMPRAYKKTSKDIIGPDRQVFTVPATTGVNIMVQVILIKKPRPEELELIRSYLGEKIPVSAKIVFNETFPLTNSFGRELSDGSNQVLATQNAGALRRSEENLARSTALYIKNMIFYAF